MTNTQSSTQQVSQRSIEDLKPHPKQEDLFRKLSEEGLQRLAEDIQANGLKHPIEILSDGTIICGHQRAAVAKRLGWTSIDVIVRTDLETQGEQAVETALISDNLMRRQMDPVEKARCLQRLRAMHRSKSEYEQRKREKAGLAHEYEKGKLRDYLGKELGVSGRTVDRYLRVLQAPRVIQDAVSEGRLPLTHANVIAGLFREEREKIAEEIQAGGDIKKIVRPYLRRSTAPAAPLGMEHYLAEAARSIQDLIAHTSQGGSTLSPEQRGRLRKLVQSLQPLLPRSDGQKKRRAGNAKGASAHEGILSETVFQRENQRSEKDAS